MVYSVVKSSTTTRDIIFLDEVWKMMTNLECAKLVYNMIKIIRGYLGSAILATQEMNDFLRGMQEYGESVLNNTALVMAKIIRRTNGILYGTNRHEKM